MCNEIFESSNDFIEHNNQINDCGRYHFNNDCWKEIINKINENNQINDLEKQTLFNLLLFNMEDSLDIGIYDDNVYKEFTDLKELCLQFMPAENGSVLFKNSYNLSLKIYKGE